MLNWFKQWVEPAPKVPVERDKARQAIADAQKSLDATTERQDEVTAVTDELRTLRQVNHFAERIEIVMRGH